MFRKTYSYSSISEAKSCGCCGSSCCGSCVKCMTRIPYASLIATILCCTGVGIFLGCFYRGTLLTLRMFEEIFKFHFEWLRDFHIVFIIIGGIMGGLSLIVLLVGCLATGGTRERVYRGWKARVGGKISCIVFMVIMYVLEVVWIAVMGCLVIVTFVFFLLWGMCNNIESNPHNKCIDLRQFAFLFPNDTKAETLKICEGGKLKNFCKHCVEPSEIMFILSLVASVLVIISLVHFLMCLASNYARIKDHEKFQELQDLQYFHDTELSTLPKDRF